MTVSARLYAVALSLSLLQHAQLVQSSSLALEYGDQRNEAAAIEHHYGVAWCRSPKATKSQGQRYAVDLEFEETK